MNGRHAFDVLHAASAITKTAGLTNAITKEVKLRTTSIATTNNFKLRDQRRIDWPGLLDTDFANHAPDSDVLINTTPLAEDHCALVHLHAFLLAFDDTDVYIDGVTNIKDRNIRLECFSVDRFDEFLGVHSRKSFISARIPALGRQQ